MKMSTIRVQLQGLRPLMFDRYAGDNNTKLPLLEKLYRDEETGRRLILPAINIYSLLCAENTKSVCKMLFGKEGKKVGLGIGSFTTIDQTEIPILRDGVQLTIEDEGKHIHKHVGVARVKAGTPNPKERPLITLPWSVEFDMRYVQNPHCTLHNLRQAFQLGEMIGLGTFRPFYGRYRLSRFDVIDDQVAEDSAA